MENKMKFRSNMIIKIFVVLLIIISSLLIVSYFVERKSETFYDYKYRSYFYQMMRRKNKFDFIKTAEKEVQNINKLLKENKDDNSLQLRIFLTEEKLHLVEEIQQTKLKIYCKEEKLELKDIPFDFKTFEKKYPELVSKYQGYGKILEYKKIDYIRIFENNKKNVRKRISKKDMDYFNLGVKHRAELKRIAEVLGAEYFGLTVSELYMNLPMEYINDYEEGTKCVESKRRQLSIHEGSQDLFYETDKVGIIYTRRNGDSLVCSVQYDSLKENIKFTDYKFVKRNNKDDYPYYFCETDECIYLIYPGISSSYYPMFMEKYYNSPYLISQDYLHSDQKKYVLVKCKKDFYKELDSFLYFFEEGVVDKILIFYQKESL